MKIKKFAALFLVLALMLSLFTACGGESNSSASSTPKTKDNSESSDVGADDDSSADDIGFSVLSLWNRSDHKSPQDPFPDPSEQQPMVFLYKNLPRIILCAKSLCWVFVPIWNIVSNIFKYCYNNTPLLL